MTSSRRYLGVGCLLLLLTLSVVPAQAYTFGGRAYSAMVTLPLLGGPTYIGDTGGLAAAGGWEGASLLNTDVPSVLTANVLVASISGATYDTGPAADGFTSLADVVVFPEQLARLTASF